MRFGDGAVIVADVAMTSGRRGQARSRTRRWCAWTTPAPTCERAREHRPRILMEPTDFEYGEQRYAEDPAGHRWTFSETLEAVAP